MKDYFLKKLGLFILLFIFCFFPLNNQKTVKADCTATIEVVFYIDTSGSMNTEWNTICGNINSVVAGVQAAGNTVYYKIYGLGTTKSCGTTAIPGHSESWGPATTWVVNNHAWHTDATIRIAVPVSDECPYEGNGCNSADTNSITTAITAATSASPKIIVSPIVSGSGSALAQTLATGTGGTYSSASTPTAIVSAMTTLITNEIGDQDGDGHLTVECGGDDCNDESASVYPGEACLDKCFGKTLKTGECMADGSCNYDTEVMVCDGLGDICITDMCEEVTSGPDMCVADGEGGNLCGGIIPCGRIVNDPSTSTIDETDPCTLCHLVLVAENSINYLVEIVGIMALLALIISSTIYIASGGNPEKKSAAKGYISNVIKGFILVLTAWLIVDFTLSIWGYTNPIGGQWNVICLIGDLLF